MALTDKQRSFVEQYLIDLNACAAAKRAGYSEASAKELGYKLLGKPAVAEAIAEAMKARADRTEITADRTLTELGKLGFANMADYMRSTADGDPFLDFSALTRDQAAALQEVTVERYTEGRGEDAREVKRVKFKLADKRASLVDIGRHLGMFKERHEVSGPDGGPIETRSMNDDEIARRLAALVAKIEADATP